MHVLIVDDQELIVEGLCYLLESRGFHVIGIAFDGQEGVEKALRLEPDLVLMDIRMPRMAGLAATRLIKARQPEIEIVMLTTSGEDQDLFEAVKSGASGYLLKSTKGAAFIETLQGLEQGIPPFSPGLAALLLREFANLAKEADRAQQVKSEDGKTGDDRARQAEKKKTDLTERQAEVLRWVAAGLTYKEVGLKLSISPETVRYHMREIMDLLHLENRSQVIAYAGKLGLQ